MKGIVLLFVLLLTTSSAESSNTFSFDPNQTVQTAMPNGVPQCGSGPVDPVAKALCDEDFRQICANQKVKDPINAEQVRNQAFAGGSTNLAELASVIATVAQAAPDPFNMDFMGVSQRHRVAKAYAGVVASVEDVIEQKFGALGVKPEDIEGRISTLKDDLLTRVKKYSNFAHTPAEDTVKSIKIVLGKSLGSMSDDQIFGYYENCGIDGLANNAFYAADIQSIVVCPGFLLSVLQGGGKLNRMDMVLSHEMGHSIDPLASTTNDMNPAFVGAYTKFLDCLNKHDQTVFGTIARSVELRRKALQVDQGCMNYLEAKSPPPEDEISILRSYDYADNMEIAQQASWDSIVAAMRTRGLTETDAVITHSRELGADFLGTDGVADQVESMPPAEKAGYLESNLSNLCPDANPDPAAGRLMDDCTHSIGPKFSDEEELELNDDGKHPVNPYRAHAFMHNPRIRAALGCAPLPVDDVHPWCSLNARPQDAN